MVQYTLAECEAQSEVSYAGTDLRVLACSSEQEASYDEDQNVPVFGEEQVGVTLLLLQVIKES